MTKFDFKLIEKFLEDQGPASKIFVGVDSVSYKKKGLWYADYYKVIVVHKDGRHGCKIFGEVETEPDFVTLTANGKKRKVTPRFRLMNEVYKASALFLRLSEITDKEIELHLDINPDKRFASGAVVDEAIGYIKATCNVIPFIKPNAVAASYAADRLLRTA